MIQEIEFHQAFNRSVHPMKKANSKKNMHLCWILSQVVFIICLCLVVFTTDIRASQTVTTVLFKGEVYLLDRDRERQEAEIGREFSVADYPWVEVAASGHLFLQSGKQLIEIESPGTYRLEDLFAQRDSVYENTLSFLKKLASPRSYITQALVRGTDGIDAETSDEEVFETFWQKVVLEKEQSETRFSATDLLTAAAWFEQKGKPARVAYLLERLNTSSGHENAFYRGLRNDALKNISLSEIAGEVENTRKYLETKINPGKNIALLIGINAYQNPSWQQLRTPVRDVRELSRLLSAEYRFAESDITLLENATYEEIVTAFNQIRQQSDEDTNLLIYYAGHGYYPPGEDEGYWIPADAGQPETQLLFLPTSTILSKIRSIESRHTLVIADSCFSGSLIRRTRGVEIHSRYYQDLSQKKSRQIITSGGLEPVSDQGWGDNSVFAGKLIDILSRERTEPLSASELALNLRKEVKSTYADQTPEYGRLHIADDQSGEFFFVRKDQDITAYSNIKVEQYPDRTMERSNPSDKDRSIEMPDWMFMEDKEGERIIIGVGLHIVGVQYNQSYVASGSGTGSKSVTLPLTGTRLQLDYKKTLDQFSYEGVFSFGQITNSATSCDQPDADAEYCEVFGGSSVNGRYFTSGIYAVYNTVPDIFVDAEFGGGLEFHHYSFDKLLETEGLNSNFIAACGRFALNFHLTEWLLGFSNDFCMTLYETSGSLSNYEDETISNLWIPFSMNFSFNAGKRF